MNMYRTSQQERTERAAQEAAEWLQIMHAKPSADERKAFAAWIASSPLHVREMLLMDMLDQELDASKALDQFDLDAIVADATADDNVVTLHGHNPRLEGAGRRQGSRRRLPRWTRIAGVAAVLLLGVASWVGVRQFTDSGVQYVTAIGQHRSITLNDGTHVAIAPDSRISVEYSPGMRRIRLRKGEAEFDVVHNASRPFRVYAGTSMIQDVGTQFSVNRLPSGTIVSVTEGTVAVSAGHPLDSGIGNWMESWLPGGSAAIKRPGVTVEPLDKPLSLGAGEAAHISRNGGVLTRGVIAAQGDVSAHTRRLTFHDDTLADIATEFNRYNARQIVVEGDSVRLQRFSGVFDANDSASFLQFLDCCSRLKVSRHGNHVVIQRGSSVQAD